jgi:hypothetical protein
MIIVINTAILKLSHYRPRRRLGGRGCIVPTHSRPRHYMGGEWSASRPGHALAPGKDPGKGGWVGPRTGLDTGARGKILSPLPGIEPRSPGRPARSQTLYWLSYPAHNTAIHVMISTWTIFIKLCEADCLTGNNKWRHKYRCINNQHSFSALAASRPNQKSIPLSTGHDIRKEPIFISLLLNSLEDGDITIRHFEKKMPNSQSV